MDTKFNVSDTVKEINGEQQMIVVNYLTNAALMIQDKLKGKEMREFEKVAAVNCTWEVEGKKFSKNFEESKLVLIK